MRILTSNLAIKVLLGALIVLGIVALYDRPSKDISCSTIESYPGRSAVYECQPGLSTAYLWNHTGKYAFATLSTSIKARAWLTKPGDDETIKTIDKDLGPAVVVGPGAYMAIANADGLVYIDAPKKVLVSIAWDTSQPAQ